MSAAPVGYRIQKETAYGATRWKTYAVHADGGETALGHYPTRKQALTATRVLAGRKPVTVGK